MFTGTGHARTWRTSKVTATFTALLLAAGTVPALSAPAAFAAPVGQGLTLNAGDMRFILKQIKIAENHATKEDPQGNPVPGQPLLGDGANQIVNPLLPYGLRTVDGSENNLVAGQEGFGAASQPFPRLVGAQFRTLPDYADKTAPMLIDGEPRVISNIIVDQTDTNPAAIAAASKAHRSVNDTATAVPCSSTVTVDCVPSGETLSIPNVTTDFGLSAPYNGMFALFGQFFDHGLDSTRKTASNIVLIPLAEDDPLYVPGGSTNFMVLSRAQNQPGPDEVLGTADDIQDATNTDSPWVDQSQTYSSHPANQVFLREYVLDAGGKPVSTGALIEGAAGGMATWADIKAQARTLLGLELADTDVVNIPMLATDQYGRFLRGPNGLPQYVTTDNTLVEGNLTTPVAPPADVQRIGIAFLDDIAHTAAPFSSRGAPLAADDDTAITPVTQPQPAGTYDDEMLNAHFIAGDGRVNENIGLTAVHQVFHSEHNRLVTYMQDLLTDLDLDLNEWQLASGEWNGERLFQAARFVTEMEYQHLVFEEFARKIQPGINPFNVFTQSDTGINPAIMAEFAHATYRFGHSMLTERVDRVTNRGEDIGMPLLDAFLNPPSYYANGANPPLTPEQAAGSIAMGMSGQVGSELDEFVTDTLRNNVLGLPLDLATLNLTRGRETGVPSLNNLRKELYQVTGDSSLKPYTSWVDFGQAIKHPDSVVNFIAAYGQHPSITAAATIAEKRIAAQNLFDMTAAGSPADSYDFVNATGTWATTATGMDSVELWVGGLAEAQNMFGGLLGSTFNYIFERQMTDLQDGDRLYYLSRTSGLNLRTQLEGNSFAELIMRNTDASALKAEVFSVADCQFDMQNIVPTANNSVADDPASACDEEALLMRMADGTIRYRTSNSIDLPGLNAQSTYNGKDTTVDQDGADRIWGGLDNDTVWGNGGNDVLEGSDGGDTILGGAGDDRITDSHGDDILKGGPGNDAIDAGPGLDVVMSGDGDDFSDGGLNSNQTFAGEGNDLVIAGDGPDTVFGGGGSDWLEGGNANDLLQGDSGAPFFDDLNKPGHDVLIGDSGEDDYDAEGGDDIMVAGPGIERNHGVFGFDWVTHARSVEPADSDMRMRIVDGPNALRDRFLLVEAISGWDHDDVLRGTERAPAEPDEEVNVPGLTNILDAAGIARIDGLADLLPVGATEFGAGNIMLGGSGSDQIWGNGADDIIDGDKWLNVRLSIRDAAGVEIRTVNALNEIKADLLAGTINPGDVAIVREILSTPQATDIDTAVFSGSRDEYTITTDGAITTVVHTGGTGLDGTDTLTNVERLRFSDRTVDLTGGPDTFAPTVVSQAPAPGAIEVPANTNVVVGFSGPVVGVNSTTFRVNNTAGTAVAAVVTYDAATSTATLNPSFNLAAGKVFTVQLSSGISDGSGNVQAPVSWSFTVAAIPDTTAPTITTRAPAADAIGVAAGTNVSASFSETVTGVSAATFQLTDPAGTAVAATVTYDATERTALLDPAADLAFETAYTVQVNAGIADPTGNPLAPTSWTFTTGPAPDVVAPTLVAANPAAGTTGVATDAPVTATFSENITGLSTDTFQLTDPAGTVVPAAVTFDPAALTGTLAPTSALVFSTTYTVRLSAGITDAAGNPLAPTSWTFSTVAAPDTLAPTVTSGVPAANTVDVAATSSIAVAFSEAVTGVNATTFQVLDPAGAAVAGTLGYDPATLTATLAPTSALAYSTTYTVRLSAGITDAAGNPLAPTSWTFTTAAPPDTVAPAVATGAPTADAVDVAVASNVTLTFTEAVTGVDGTTFRLLNAAGTVLAATVGYDAATLTATLNPGVDLAFRSTYTVQVTDGIIDAAGNPMGLASWSFTTQAVPLALVNSHDFSSDGNPDVIARDNNGRLWLYRGDGTGGFLRRTQMGTGWNGMSVILTTGDLSGDGRADIIVRDGIGRLWLYPGSGAGTLQTRVLIGSGWNVMTSIFGPGDFDGDAQADLIARDSDGLLWLYRGRSDGTFLPRVQIGIGWNVMTSIFSPGDFDGDGASDVLARDSLGRLWMYRGNGLGGFTSRVQIGTGWNSMTSIFGPGDFDRDSNADVLSRDSNGRLWMYRGNGLGGFLPRVQIGTSWNGMSAIL